MKPKKGEYFYMARGRNFCIYRYEYVDAKSFLAAPAPDEPPYWTREEARRRVYELNGWNYKRKGNNEQSANSPAR